MAARNPNSPPTIPESPVITQSTSLFAPPTPDATPPRHSNKMIGLPAVEGDYPALNFETPNKATGKDAQFTPPPSTSPQKSRSRRGDSTVNKDDRPRLSTYELMLAATAVPGSGTKKKATVFKAIDPTKASLFFSFDSATSC